MPEHDAGGCIARTNCTSQNVKFSLSAPWQQMWNSSPASRSGRFTRKVPIKQYGGCAPTGGLLLPQQLNYGSPECPASSLGYSPQRSSGTAKQHSCCLLWRYHSWQMEQRHLKRRGWCVLRRSWQETAITAHLANICTSDTPQPSLRWLKL